MATKILKTQRKLIFSENLMTENPENTLSVNKISPNLIREGGRTVGSDGVADIEAVLVVETTDKERRYLNQDGQDMVKI